MTCTYGKSIGVMGSKGEMGQIIRGAFDREGVERPRLSTYTEPGGGTIQTCITNNSSFNYVVLPKNVTVNMQLE